MRNKQPIAIGDWVKGKTKNGELIQGFVDFIDPIEGRVRVYVVICDNEETVGRIVQTLSKWLEKIPTSYGMRIKSFKLWTWLY